jgi:hypothetical protein
LAGACDPPGAREELSTNEAPLLATEQKIAAVSYFRNSNGYWDDMLVVPPVDIVMINPSDGPGSSFDQQIEDLVTLGHNAGAKVIGYVTSDYTVSTLNTVENEVDSYYNWYDVDGIFVDEVHGSNCTQEDSYYHPLFSDIKAHDSSAIVIINPGAATNSCYLDSADIIVTFEGCYDYGASPCTDSSYVNGFTSSGWDTPANAGRVWHIIHDTFGQADALDALQLSRERNAGYVYVNEDHYSFLPAYWQAELDDVTAFNDSLGTSSGGNTWIRASNNASSNFYRFEFTGTNDYHRVYIDTNENATSGFAYCGLGAEYLIENTHLYAYTGDGSSWSWNDLGTTTNTITPTSASWTIARSSLNETASPNGANACFEVKNTAGVKTTSSVYHHAYSDESGPVHAYFAENDSTNIRYQADFDTSYAQKHVFIDTDLSSSGYSVGGIGADYMIENGTLYDYTGTGGSNWAWTSIGSASMTPSTVGATGTTTWTIARSSITETGSGQSSRIVFHGRVTGGGSEYTTPIYLHTFSN